MNSYTCCVASSKESKQVSKLSTMLQLVSEENRLKILCILKQGEHCVCKIKEHIDVSQSLISHHLKDLKDAGMVTDDKRGMYVYYRLTKTGEKITHALFQL
jgi:ArsR family transcriptional regulator